jgi:hypothetical protein
MVTTSSSTKICETCGLPFGRKTIYKNIPHTLSWTEFTKRRFCSKECAGNSKILTQKVCEFCSTKFHKRANETLIIFLSRRFCSVNCVNLGKQKRMTLDEQFWSKIDRKGPSDCWLWQGATGKKGYGYFNDRGKLIRSHRFSWELTNKQSVPKGLLVCHSCDNPPCCNPNHLWVGTAKDNTEDMIAKGRQHKTDASNRIRTSSGRFAKVGSRPTEGPG